MIPCLDVKDGRVVKGVNFTGLRDAGDPVELARHYDSEGADELVFLDITASHEGRAPVIDLAAKVAEEVFIPYTVGGGIRTVEDIRLALLAGADKVSLNSAALADPSLVRRASEACGAQCVVIAIDVRRKGNSWEVYSHGGRTATGRDLLEWAEEVAFLGAGEVLLTSMDGDGTQAGYDLAATLAVSDRLGVPVIASGGAGAPEDLVAAILEGNADAVLLASILHDGIFRIQDLKEKMREAGIQVRMVSEHRTSA